MRQQLSIVLVAALAALLLLSAVVANDADAKKKKKPKLPEYKGIVNIKYYGDAYCIAQKTDEAYYRISSEFKNSQNNDNHDQLVVKGELENLGNYLINLQRHNKPLVVTFIGYFDPDKFFDKYGVPLQWLREYIEHYKHVNGQQIEVQDEYKQHRPFNPEQKTYTWNHGVDFGCR